MIITKEEAIALVENLADIKTNPSKLKFERVEALPISTLKKMASYLQIKGYSKMRKAELANEVFNMLNCLREDSEHKLNASIEKEDAERLSNGAIEILRKKNDSESDVVLARFNGEYVVWLHVKENDAYIYGRYHCNYEDALEAYNRGY